MSLIIVNWNTRDLLAGCLESLRFNVSTFERLSIETFVVDNASTDGSVQMVRERFPWVQLFENPENAGFARANNQGIQASKGQYILLLNSDTVVHPGALETLLTFMDEHPQAGACGPRLLNGDGSLQPSVHPMLTPTREFWRLLFLDRLWPLATYPQDRWDVTTPKPVETIKGACLLLRRTALDQVGLLDESYFMYTEEVDLCYRLARAGWQLWYVPQSVVTHFGGGSSKQIQEEMYLELYRSKVRFYRKFGGRQRANLFKRYLVVAYGLRAGLFTTFSLFRPHFSQQARLYRALVASLSGM